MAKAYKRLRRQRTQRRLKNQSFMEPSKRPLQGRREIVHSISAREPLTKQGWLELFVIDVRLSWQSDEEPTNQQAQ